MSLNVHFSTLSAALFFLLFFHCFDFIFFLYLMLHARASYAIPSIQVKGIL